MSHLRPSLASSSRSVVHPIPPSRPLQRPPLQPASSMRMRMKSTSSTSTTWPTRTHLLPAPSIPPPLPPLFPHRILLSDGSSFTAYTTAPTTTSGRTLQLTRDVRNNPLWAPASEVRGAAGAEEGRVGRFRRRFEGLGEGQAGQAGGAAKARAGGAEQGRVQAGAGGGGDGGKAVDGSQGGEAGGKAFDSLDLEWMSEGAVEEKIGNVAKGGGKGKRK